MEYLLVSFLFLALWHFVYGSIIAPTYRQHKRSELFAQRDELRRLQLTDNIDENDFNLVHDYLNFCMVSLGKIDFIDLYLFRREYHKDSLIRKEVDAHQDIYTSLKDERARNIVNRAADSCLDVLFVNAGHWLIWLIPIFIVYLLGNRINHYFRLLITQRAWIYRDDRGSSYHYKEQGLAFA